MLNSIKLFLEVRAVYLVVWSVTWSLANAEQYRVKLEIIRVEGIQSWTHPTLHPLLYIFVIHNNQILILLKRSVVELTEKLEFSDMLLAIRHGPKGGVSIAGDSALPSSRLAEVVVAAFVLDLM